MKKLQWKIPLKEKKFLTFTNKTIDADGTGNSITNIEDANIKAAAAIDATKIANGTVTTAEFQYINTLSSNAQTQIDAKAATTYVDDAVAGLRTMLAGVSNCSIIPLLITASLSAKVIAST